MDDKPETVSKAVVSGGLERWKLLWFRTVYSRSSRHPRIWLFVGAVALLVVIVFGWYWVNNKPKLVAQEAAFNQALTLVNNSGYSQGQKYLDAQLSASNDVKHKSDIYIDKATLALNNKDYANALQYARQSEALQPTVSSAVVIAQSAELSGDKATAIKYYQITIDRMKQSKLPYDTDIAEYTQKIKDLSK